jgi:hypothetical protein
MRGFPDQYARARGRLYPLGILAENSEKTAVPEPDKT